LKTDPDAKLIDKTLTGELAAFETLVERHRDVVYRVAARIVGQEDAADVTQDAFLRAFHRLDRFRGAAPFRSWLLQSPRTSPATRSRASVTPSNRC